LLIVPDVVPDLTHAWENGKATANIFDVSAGTRHAAWGLVIMNVQTACTPAQLDQVLADTPFLKSYGFKVQSCAVGECTLVVPFCPSMERPGGIVSGMTIMGAADVAMWLAIMTQRGTRELWVTSDMKTAFLSSARQADICCVARVLKLGKRTAYGMVETRDGSENLLAHHVITYAHVPVQ
jgi:acyl-coenzyme A thioesterase PaaI-like protein